MNNSTKLQNRITAFIVIIFLLPFILLFIVPEQAHFRNSCYIMSIFLLFSFFRHKEIFYNFEFHKKNERTLLIFIFFVIFICQQSNFFGLRVSGFDFGVVEHMLVNTLNANFMYTPLTNMNHFALHQTWTLLLLLPFKYLFPESVFLVILGSLIIVLPILFIYKLSNLYKNPPIFTYLLIYCFIMSSYYTTVINGNFRLAYLTPVLVFGLLYFLKRERFLIFLLFSILFLGIKEDKALYLIMFGFSLLFSKKIYRRYGITAILLSIFFLAINYYVKNFILYEEAIAGRTVNYWSEYGTSMFEIFLGIIQSPFKAILSILKSSWIKLYIPLLILPLLNLQTLFFSIPGIIILGTSDFYAMRNYGAYYPLLLYSISIYSVCIQYKKISNIILKSAIPISLILFPTFYSGYLKLYPVKLENFKSVKKMQTFLLESNLKNEKICTQAILFPYLGFKLKLSEFTNDCIKKDNLLLISTYADPYPYSKDEINLLVAKNKTVKHFEHVYLIRINQSSSL